MVARETHSFWQRIRRRKLVQWALAYLAAAWVALQLLTILASMFAWPPLVPRLALLLLALGLPAALVLGWYHGEKGRQTVGSGEVLLFAGLLVVAGVGLALVREFGGGAPEASPAPRAENPVPERVAEDSVAVLPFVNVSADPENAYFAYGVTEEIITALSQIDRLKVAARTSSFFYDGKDVPLPRMARELGVAYVLEGSVRRARERVRITAQLIDASNGYHVWSQNYDRTLEDTLAIQSEIANSVAGALQVEISGPAGGGVEATHDIQAREFYYKALFITQDTERFRREHERALMLLRSAIDSDPDYALARAALASTLCAAAMYGLMDTGQVIDEADAQAQRALELEPGLAEAHIARGNVAMLRLEWPAVRKAMLEAVSLNPNSAKAHARLSISQTYFGEWDEAVRHSRIAAQLDPVNAGSVVNYAEMLNIVGEPGGAVRVLEDTLELAPSLDSIYPALVRSYVLAGDPHAAMDTARRFRERAPGPSATLLVGYTTAALGQKARAREILAEVGEPRAQDLVLWVMVLAALGDTSRALDLTERAAAEIPLVFALYAYLPELDPLRRLPRFREALAGLNIPDPDPPVR